MPGLSEAPNCVRTRFAPLDVTVPPLIRSPAVATSKIKFVPAAMSNAGTVSVFAAAGARVSEPAPRVRAGAELTPFMTKFPVPCLINPAPVMSALLIVRSFSAVLSLIVNVRAVAPNAKVPPTVALISCAGVVPLLVRFPFNVRVVAPTLSVPLCACAVKPKVSPAMA